jgi:tetratricopeptide (TPR) repeat protein
MPNIAFLPFNVGEPIRPALGRQLSQFLSEAYKVQPEVATNFVNYLAQVGTQEAPEAALVNFGSELNGADFINQVFEQSNADFVVDGVLKPQGDEFALTFRLSSKKTVGQVVADRQFAIPQIFATLRWMVSEVAKGSEIVLLPEFAEKMEFGTEDAQAFYEFMLGFDAISYIGQAGAQVAKSFDLGTAFDDLLSAIERDKDFLGPYEAALQLSQLAAQFGVGTAEVVEAKLKKLNELVPDDWRGYYGLAGIYAGTGNLNEAANLYEKAIRVLQAEVAAKEQRKAGGEDVEVPDVEPALYTRLGIVQQQLGMVANAERSYKKALDLEGPDKPTMDFLAALMNGTGRGHEVPTMWKAVVDQNQKSGAAWAKYAISLLNAGRENDGRKAFEDGLAASDGDAIVKRFFAPYLAGKEEYDRAMDYYEDCIDEQPEDIPLLFEYAQTLAKAGRQHEVADVLKKILEANPDLNMRANAQAWLYEIEQPKRIDVMQRAQEHMEKEEFKLAIDDLEPMKEWMQDYWKLWAMLSTLYNRTQRFEDAEAAARKVIELFPACEPAYGELTSALVGQGRAEEAYSMLSTVLRAMPSSFPIAINLAMAAKQTGRRDEATRLAKQLREAAGAGNVELERVLAEIESA